jgi:hypothetical protein
MGKEMQIGGAGDGSVTDMQNGNRYFEDYTGGSVKLIFP